ncbi:endospore germination permease [Paenibacillus sp. NPDC058071]|uniref:GerAB/ArcD/ProY family transporter n=1 Tax=Paenibacillus sp. NPDC058071 TaxID=3346326 RepID=UPI0036D87DF7
MLEKGRISSAQLACMTYLSLLATAMLTSPFRLYKYAHTASWLIPSLASIVGFAAVAIMVRLHRLYPGQSLVQYAEQIVGKPLGKAFGLVFLVVMTFQNGHQMRQFTDFMGTAFFDETPGLIISASMLAVSAFAARLGVEVIARCAQILAPVIVIITLLLSMPLAGNIQVDHMLPLLESDWMSITKAMVYMQIWFPMFAYTTFFLPFLRDPDKAAKWGFLSVCWTVVTFTGTMLIVLLVLGEAVTSFNYPFMMLTRYVSLFSFVSRLDSLIVLFWVLDVFIRCVMLHYASALGFAQWFGLPDYRPLVLPIAILVFELGKWSFHSMIELYALPFQFALLYLTIAFLVPLLLFLVSLLRGQKPPPGNAAAADNAKLREKAPASS